MGTGKSFWGKKWAKHFGCSFIDLDDAIVEKEGSTITTIFETQGEKYFRDVETLVLRETEYENNAIIACGGGTPCFNKHTEWMNANGVTVYLSRQPIELYKNLAKQTLKRPLLKNKNEQEMLFYIEQKLKERTPFYEQANITLDTETIDIHSIDKIVNIIALK